MRKTCSVFAFVPATNMLYNRSDFAKLFLFGTVIISMSVLVACESEQPTLKFEKASFKVTYVQADEKIQRIRVATEASNVKEIGIDKFIVSADDSIGAQASIVNEQGDAVSVSQVFLRFLNKHTLEDNIYALRKKGRDMKLDFGLHKEIRKDLGFWQHDASYRVELIYGDVKLVESGIWVITDNMRFSERSANVFKENERGVFDFDVGAKWKVGPEFEAPTAVEEKRAAPAMIFAAVVGVIVPFFVLMATWAKMGALNIELPEKGKGAAIGLEACVLGHAVALGMFWWQWNIVMTWKVVGAIMVPTLVFARGFLRTEVERKD